MFRSYFQKLNASEFGRNVLTLASGSILAQAIPVLISPILTRIYSPESFGIFALFVSLISVLSVFATARYAFAIVIPKEEEEAKNLVALCLGIAVLTALLLFIVLLLFGVAITSLLNMDRIHDWILLIPISLLLCGFYETGRYWANRHKFYKLDACTKVVRSVTRAASAISLGLISFRAAGLIFSLILAELAGALMMLAGILKTGTLTQTTWSGIKKIAARFQKFPKVLLPAHLINMGAQEMPILLMTPFFGASVVGQFALANRVVRLPLTMVANSIGDVFRQRAANDLAHKGNCRDIFLKTAKLLAGLSLLFFGTLFILTPYVFPFVFGANWKTAGTMVQILTLMLATRFVASIMSNVIIIREKHKFNILWQSSFLLFGALTITLGYFAGGYFYSLIFYAASGTMHYLVMFWFSYRYSLG